MTDVVIAGGGIAGSALAILLGRAGLSVELFERARFPREKPCGEGIMPAGVAALARLGLRDALGGRPFQGVRYLSGGLIAEGRFPSSAGAPTTGIGLRRLHLDQRIFDTAAATAGVRAYSGVAVQAPLLEDGRVCGLRVQGVPRRARLVVAADGAGSPLRRALGLDGTPRSRVRVGIRTHFRLAPGHAQPPWVEVYLGRGYELYVTPLPDGEVLVAALAERSSVRGSASTSFASWLDAQPTLRERLQGAERVSPYSGRSPLASPAKSGVAPGVVLLGDAAGYVDPITGGGITQALLSAELLAGFSRQILTGGDEWLWRFERERRALLRDYLLLTRLVLAISKYQWLASSTVRLMHTLPRLFSHLIGVSAGTGELLSFPKGR